MTPHEALVAALRAVSAHGPMPFGTDDDFLALVPEEARRVLLPYCEVHEDDAFSQCPCCLAVKARDAGIAEGRRQAFKEVANHADAISRTFEEGTQHRDACLYFSGYCALAAREPAKEEE